MKKRLFSLISMLLCLTMVMGAVCSCSTSREQSSSDEPSDSGESSPDTSEEVSEPIVTINRNQKAVNLAKGKSYTSSIAPEEKFADKGKMLTDGIVPDLYDGRWVGYANSSGLEITLDLGKVENDLADFSVRALSTLEWQFGLPRRVTFEISEDGENYVKIGTAYNTADALDKTATDFMIKLAKPVSARYVRLTFGSNESVYLILAEIQVIRYDDSHVDKTVAYYSERKIPDDIVATEWPEDQQSDKTVNLISKLLPYSITTGTDMTESEFATEYYNTKQTLNFLTDGRYGTPSEVTSSKFVHFTRHFSREITYDFGYISAVSGVQLSFLQCIKPAINLPDYVRISLSENGKDWQCVYEDTELFCELDGIYREKHDFDKIYRARFVKIEFQVISHVYCDEIQIYGTKKIPAEAVTVDPEKSIPLKEDIGYITPDQFDGIENVLLSYHCYPEENGVHPEGGLITVEEYMPYVGYYDKTGKLVDTFFDGFLYIPNGRFSTTEGIRTYDGWKYYNDDIYTKDRNMDALNQAVGIVKKELDRPDYLATVYTSILYPGIYPGLREPIPFGDFDGDGVEESFDNLEFRIATVKWMMDDQYSRFVAGNFENLTFGGFYWYDEILVTHNRDDLEIIRFASDYAHQLGTKLFWIPYAYAAGYYSYQNYGIDLACMQPNYMFGQPLSYIEDISALAKRHGMCIEMEFTTTNNEDIRRYMKYLEGGVRYGYMNAVKMYYQGEMPGGIYDSYKAQSPYARSVYDLTYQYAKRLLTEEAPAHTIKQTEFVCTKKTLQSKLIVETENYCRFNIAVSPEHGSVRLDASGLFVYYREEDFEGTDTFSIVLDYGYTKSEEIVITVNVDHE